LTPELWDVILAAIESRLGDVFVARPGIIRSYDAASQTATVQPAIREAYVDETDTRQTEAQPPIQKVPVVFPGSGTSGITWPVNKGDTCLLVHCDVSIDTWLATGGVVDPQDDRRHDHSDVVAIVGLRSYRGSLPSSATDGTATVVYAPQIKLGDASASHPVPQGDNLQSSLNTLAAALSTFLTALSTW